MPTTTCAALRREFPMRICSRPRNAGLRSGAPVTSRRSQAIGHDQKRHPARCDRHRARSPDDRSARPRFSARMAETWNVAGWRFEAWCRARDSPSTTSATSAPSVASPSGREARQPAPRRASLPILRDGTRSRRRHGSLIGARRLGAALGRIRARPTGKASALHAGAGDVLAGLAGARNRPAARGGVGADLVWGEPRRRILVPTCGESLSPELGPIAR